MKIKQGFVQEILESMCGEDFQKLFDESLLIQYIDKKTGAVIRDCTARRNLANLYAIYSMTHFYQNDYYEKRDEYDRFEGYRYNMLKDFANSLYGGKKLQNHSFNDRLAGEFKRKKKIAGDLIINNEGRYKIHPDYLYVNNKDISNIVNVLVEKYIELIRTKDENTINMISAIVSKTCLEEKRVALKNILAEKAEARLFEIISYAILKRYYASKTVWYGKDKDAIKEYNLNLYKTGRTNANDGGIDFVLKPIGRFFQVTEVGKYNKYFLDIDKVMRYPITFVVKSDKQSEEIHIEMEESLKKQYGTEMSLIEAYRAAIEEIITLENLNDIIDEFSEKDIADIVQEIILYFKLEMNIDDSEIETMG